MSTSMTDIASLFKKLQTADNQPVVRQLAVHFTQGLTDMKEMSDVIN